MSKIVQLLTVPDEDGAVGVFALHEDGEISRLQFDPPEEEGDRWAITPIMYELFERE